MKAKVVQPRMHMVGLDIDEDWGEAHIRRHLIKRVSIACAVMNMPLPRTIQYRRSASGHGWHARVPLYGRFWKQQLLLWRQIAGDDPMRVLIDLERSVGIDTLWDEKHDGRRWKHAGEWHIMEYKK